MNYLSTKMNQQVPHSSSYFAVLPPRFNSHVMKSNCLGEFSIEIAHHLLTEVSPQRFFSKNAVIVQSVILALNSRACSTLMGRS